MIVNDETIALGNANLPIPAEAVGLCSWDMVANNLCGDAEMARVFAMDSAELAAGITVERLIGCLHVDDRERFAKSLHEAIVNGTLCRESYRVNIGKGRYRTVLGVMRCFGYSEGMPTTCSGFVCEMPSQASKPAAVPQNHSNVVPLRTLL